MRRVFGNIDFNSKEVIFSEDTLRHLEVIRINLNEEIEVISSSKAYLCKVISIRPIKVILQSLLPSLDRELPFESILLLPLLKKDNFELCLQKGTELGVATFIPYISSRVIVRLDASEFEKKRDRYQKIIKEAVQQSNRTVIPTLLPLHKYNDVLKIEGDYKYIAYEDEALKGSYIREVDFKNKKVVSLIGPEGGFSTEEVKKAVENKFILTSLGKRILRAETGVYSILSIINYIGEKDV